MRGGDRGLIERSTGRLLGICFWREVVESIMRGGDRGLFEERLRRGHLLAPTVTQEGFMEEADL
jgi:hypothetical protein